MQVGVREVISDVEQGLSGRLRQAVGQAVAEVQARRVAAALPEVRVGGPRRAGLGGIEGNQPDVQQRKELVETTTEHRIAESINHGGCLDVAGRGDLGATGGEDGFGQLSPLPAHPA